MAKLKRPKRGYPRYPTDINGTSWFYYQKRGIQVVAERRLDDGTYVATASTIIPWKKITAIVSMRRRVQAEQMQ